jgi:hypothetical protein
MPHAIDYILLEILVDLIDVWLGEDVLENSQSKAYN